MSIFLDAAGQSDQLDAELHTISGAGQRLAAIGVHVHECVRCGLHVHRVRAVPGEGSARAKMMIVGEAPGRMEDAAGLPFVGKSGELLDRMLASADIRRGKVFITSVVKCRPVNVVGGRLKNRAPKGPEISACMPYLVRQLRIVQPRTIVCLGAVAARTMIDPGFNITGQRGEWFDGPFGSRILATFHPAYVLRQGGASAAADKIRDLVRSDFEKARREAYPQSS